MRRQQVKQKEPTIDNRSFNEQDSLLSSTALNNSKSSTTSGITVSINSPPSPTTLPPTSTIQKALIESSSGIGSSIETGRGNNNNNKNNKCCYCCCNNSCCNFEKNQICFNSNNNNNNNNLTQVEDNQEFKSCGFKMSKSTRLLTSYFIAELLGTFLLVVIGDGAIAAYVLTKKEIDTFTACFAFGVGAMIATFTAAKISGAHINPAASFAFALNGKLNWKLVPIYICAQYLGGFLGALVLMVNYAEAIQQFGNRSAFGSTNSTGQIFATYPGEWVSIWGSLLDQIIGTAILLFSLSAITDKNNANLEERHQPIYIAFTIGIVCVSFSPNCGAIFNPARDLAPRLLTLAFGYPNVFKPISGLYWFTAGVLGPHIGAIVGVFTYKLLIGSSLAKKHEYEFDHNQNQHQHHHHLNQQEAYQCEQQKRNHHHHHHHQYNSGNEQVVPMQTSKFTTAT